MRDEEKSLGKSLLDGFLALAGIVWLGMIVLAMVIYFIYKRVQAAQS